MRIQSLFLGADRSLLQLRMLPAILWDFHVYRVDNFKSLHPNHNSLLTSQRIYHIRQDAVR